MADKPEDKKPEEEPKEPEKNDTPKEEPGFIDSIIGKIRNAVKKVFTGIRDFVGKGFDRIFGEDEKKPDIPKETPSGSTDEKKPDSETKDGNSTSADKTPADEKTPEKTADNLSRQYKQWTLEATNDQYSITNKGSDGKKQFYEVTPGPYGNPIITVEPDLAFPVPSNLTYKDAEGKEVKPTEKIGGLIFKDENGKVIHRFSLSSKDKPKYESVEGSENAEIKIGDKIWYLNQLFSKDKNRIIGYDAYYSEKKPDSVRIIELQDIPIQKAT